MDTTQQMMVIKKVYVAVGNDFQEGLVSLDWALKNWYSQSISIVILHVNNTSTDFVYTPFGKLPASSVSDGKLELLRMCEKEKINKSLSKYRAFCGKMNVEILKIEKLGEPIHKVIVEMISNLRITKLVMGLAFIKSKSSKSSIGGSFYVHKNKPDFCELFIICGGKLVILREENNGEGCGNGEGFVENDRKIVKDKGSSFKGWVGKMFTADNNYSPNNQSHQVAPTTGCNYLQAETRDWWKNYVQEIENYIQGLSINSNLEESWRKKEEDNAIKLEAINPNVKIVDAAEILRAKIEEALKTIQEKNKETIESLDKKAKAEWIISLCDRRAGELEKCINQEITDQNELKRNLETSKEELHEISSEIKDSNKKLKSILELQSELAKKLQCSSTEKSHYEVNLVKAVAERTEMVRDIEKIRYQKDVFRRRIEFCREKEAILATGTVSVELNSYREFSVDELREATDDLSERLRLKSRSGAGTSVFRGMLNHTTVAIRFHTSLSSMSQEEFKIKMELLQQIRHPYLIAMIGACCELKCIIYEYMHNRSLHEVLFSSSPTITNPRKRVLSWPIRIQIAAQICSGLGFLHLTKPKPISHGSLNPSNILLDHHLVAKITDFKLDHSDPDSEFELKSDVYDFGILMMQLLTGREKDGLVEEVRRAVECGVLNEVAGQWPLDLAKDFAQLALRCVQVNDDQSRELRMTDVRMEIEEMKKKAEEVVEAAEVYIGDVPNIFLCPIFQEVMENPHVAADGFTYELEAIEGWLATGKETSPMTNVGEEAEVWAMFEGIRWARAQELKNIVIEGDAKILIDIINKNEIEGFIIVCNILVDFLDCMNSFEFVSCVFFHRICNRSAHTLAHWPKVLGSEDV